MAAFDWSPMRARLDEGLALLSQVKPSYGPRYPAERVHSLGSPWSRSERGERAGAGRRAIATLIRSRLHLEGRFSRQRHDKRPKLVCLLRPSSRSSAAFRPRSGSAPSAGSASFAHLPTRARLRPPVSESAQAATRSPRLAPRLPRYRKSVALVPDGPAPVVAARARRWRHLARARPSWLRKRRAK